MHKCIMVKLGENEKPVKYVKTRKFYEIRGKFEKGGKIIILRDENLEKNFGKR